ncbi:MAG: trypsin-like peptidase domain-containing protein, partial [Spirochaetales bacterium]|nr:trypsin-like peptidase domain-containing protein [Spirochaetales bacterium]
MSARKILYSKKFFIFNLVFISVLIGFISAFALFSYLSGMRTPQKVYALQQEGPESDNEDIIPDSFRAVVKDVMPSVVQVNVVETRETGNQFDFPFNPFSFPDEGKKKQYKNEGLGSGVIVHQDGKKNYVLTNSHVVGTAEEITVILQNHEEYSASLVGKDERSDLALLVFESRDRTIKTARLGDSDMLETGDWVLAIGHPFGYFSSVSAGIVSAKGRSGPHENINEFIQTDAAINQGNSGGALINTKGEVIGINTWIATPTGTYIGLGFSIPINNAKKAINDFISFGEIEYGWLGVSHVEVDNDYKKELLIEKGNGVFIPSVYFNSPAYKGGIRAGDFIISVNGKDVEDNDDLARFVGNLKAGENADFVVYRNGEKLTFRVEMGKRSSNTNINPSDLWPGVFVVPLNEELRNDLDIDPVHNGI